MKPSAIEQFGGKVKIVMGAPLNIKVIPKLKINCSLVFYLTQLTPKKLKSDMNIAQLVMV